MCRKIKIQVDGLELIGILNDTKTAKQIWDVLPIESQGNLWGEEIYFSIPVYTGPENPKETVEIGELGYWPDGNAFCIFYGLTPCSIGDEIRPASPVNIVGNIQGDAKILKNIRTRCKVKITKL